MLILININNRQNDEYYPTSAYNYQVKTTTTSSCNCLCFFSLLFVFLLHSTINPSSTLRHIVNVHSSTTISMYNKCRCCAYVLVKKRRRLRQGTSSPLLSNRIIPLQLIQPSRHIIVIIGSCYQHKIEVKRRCNCRPMNLRRIIQRRQTSTDGMLVNIDKHVTSNHTTSIHVRF